MNACLQLPEQLQERLSWLYDEQALASVYDALSHEVTPTFRVNTLKAPISETADQLTKQGFSITPLIWYDAAFQLHNKSIRELTETDVYKAGHIYIQNASSMIPPLVLDPQPEEKILDLTAAPGSKTTQIAALMQNTGELTANDVSYKRLFKLKENITSMGVVNAKVLNLPGESFWKNLPEYFDRTLVDVPCSMEGRINCNDPKSYKDWSTKKVKQLSKLQKYLLRSAVAATKVGGIIVYSSCTLSPEENEEVIEWLMKKTPNALQVEKITIPGLSLSDGLKTWKSKTFEFGDKTTRVIPSREMEGFFVAKISKYASTLPK